ncbi:MAG: DUF4238 domain-containing protein [Candidatus Delongbacteria bacterium]|jgi:hypothetical protein|nr:DUF4238 domain-containing protein [Candidatus Delongbacteria bacterium]
MAGKRHHFIPQFLQKGFISHKSGKNSFTWVYRKDRSPFNSNIINIRIEKHFYSIDKEVLLDDLITEYENDINNYVKKLQNNGILNSEETEKTAKLIAHFEVRTNHLRKSFLESNQFLMNEFTKYIDDTDFFTNFYINEIKKNPSILKEEIDKNLINLNIPSCFHSYINELFRNNYEVFAPIFLKDFIPVLAQIMKTKLPEVLVQSVKKGHIKLLTNTLSPELKLERYKKLEFKLHYSGNVSIPLGDSIVIYHIKNPNREFKPFLESDEIIKAVLLPISSNYLLIGSIENYKPNFELIKNEIIKCSCEYFISNERYSNFNELNKFIGTNSHFITKEQAEEMMRDIMLKGIKNYA